jgi:hypothetical protein
MDKYNNNMESQKLNEIINSVGSKSNKQLLEESLLIRNDFDIVKNNILALTNILNELETAYDIVYNELQKRLKFKDEQ